MQARDRLVVAVDLSSRDDILRLVDRLQGSVGIFKIGLQAFITNGPSVVREIVSGGERVFLDLKIHDIPNTAKHAVAEAAQLGASMATVHAAGGEGMLRACADADDDRSLLVLAVTELTSLTEADLLQIGMGGLAVDNAVRLARLAQEAGLRGVVASPLEIEPIREACGAGFTILTPGIRPAGSDVGDQKRVMTPRDAVTAGADYIVVGRPITNAADPRSAALAIVEKMS